MLINDKVVSNKILVIGDNHTMISTTRMAMLHKELPRVRKFVKDSCPGVSMTSRPGILYSCDPS